MNDTLKVAGRIGAELGAARAENERLRGLLREARELIERGDFREGYCMCGSAVDTHTFGDGHIPCDAGEYYASQVSELIDAALSQQTEISTTKHKPHCLLLDPEEPQCHCSCGLEPAPEPRDKRIRPSYLDQAVIDRVAESSARHLEEIGRRLADPAPAQDDREAVERFSPTTSVPHCGRASEVEAYMTEDDDGEYMTVSQHERIVAALTRPAQTEQQPEQSGKFAMHQRVRKTSGSEWQGRICGTYSTALTPEGYAVESEAHAGSVQIYPAKALEAVE